MADIEYSSRAADWLRDADPDVTEQIVGRIEKAEDFPSHFLTRLSNSPFHKLRAGDYRIIVNWKRNEDVLFIRKIGHRKNIYD